MQTSTFSDPAVLCTAGTLTRRREKKMRKEERKKRKRESTDYFEQLNDCCCPDTNNNIGEEVIEQKRIKSDNTMSINLNNNNKEKSSRNARNRITNRSWNFEVDYNDHFETPKQAYIDLLPWLEAICSQMQKPRNELRIYDPYFCQGKMKEYLNELGFSNVINENRDFYDDIRKKTIPDCDVLITNPPYSGEHKTKLLHFLENNKRGQPFALLLPVYTVTKSYWRDYLARVDSNSYSFYILPPDYYEYRHPEGTGKNIPPFYSSWILGGMSSEVKSISLLNFRGNTRKPSSSGLPMGVKRLPFQHLVTTDNIETIVSLGLVTEKRPNPKQRKKIQKKLEANK